MRSYQHKESTAFVASFFFFNDTATTEIYTLSLHDALPILSPSIRRSRRRWLGLAVSIPGRARTWSPPPWLLRLSSRRSEEHTSELQSRQYLVCRLLLEKKKRKNESFTATAGF